MLSTSIVERRPRRIGPPVNTEYRKLFALIDPDLKSRLVELSKARGISLSCFVATLLEAAVYENLVGAILDE